MYDEQTYARVLAWCEAHSFIIEDKISEHVIEVKCKGIDGAPALYTMAASVGALPKVPAQPPQSIAAAEHIFDIAMDTEEPRNKRSIHRCEICTEMARNGHSVGNVCARQFLLLCPDVIIACCCDSDARIDSRCSYVIVHHIHLDVAPILDIRGRWTFDFMQRIKFNLTTQEGFITFRTFIVYNVARICPAGTAPPPAGAATTSSKASNSPHSFRIMRKSSRIEQVAHEQPASFYVIRNRFKEGILFVNFNTLVEAIRAIPTPVMMSDDTAREFEDAALNIFKNEPRLIYSSRIFAPPSAAPVASAASAASAFNSWSGWWWSLRGVVSSRPQSPTAGALRNPAQTVAPIVSFINEIWCGGIGSGGAPERAQFIISWFAHILQSPGSPPERQILFRGFPASVVVPLLKFIGRNVIGCQYFNSSFSRAVSQRDIADVRDDCLFTIVEDYAPKDLKGIMRESRALWVSTAPIKLSTADKLAKRRGIPIEADRRVLDESKIIARDRHSLLRVAVVLKQSDQLAIEQQRRRFCVLDYGSGAAASIEARLKQLDDAMAREHCANDLFCYLMQFRPLTLFWDI
jgi:hypothetical protein